MMKIKKIIGKVFLLLLVISVSYFYEVYFNDLEDENIVEMKEVINTDNSFKIYFLDVGEADSVLITSGGEYTLIDAGNNNDGKRLVNYFKSLGINNFKYVIATHAHEDHIGGMDDIINNFSIEHFYMPNVITTTKTFEDVLNALDTNNIKFETPNVDSSFYTNDVLFSVLHVGSDSTDLNSTSIVLKVTYYNTSYLMMADATGDVERSILEKDIKSDLLKVSHHGSSSSTIAQFLRKVDPKYAVIQVGRDNEYGLPKQVTLDKLNRLNIKIYRTDLDGTIILNSDGTNITFDKVETDIDGG